MPQARPASAPRQSSARSSQPGQGLPTPFAESVLDAVAAIPPGQVRSYGRIAQELGSRSPRSVGAALARFGGGVPWWRVVHSDGRLPAGLAAEATDRLRAEGIKVASEGGPPRVVAGPGINPNGADRRQ
jgi:alkylated DNA nucleotide flippase Atl1